MKSISKQTGWRTLLSVLAAAFGVQSNKNYQHDFQMNSPVPFIVLGGLFVLGFILLLMLVVHWVIG